MNQLTYEGFLFIMFWGAVLTVVVGSVLWFLERGGEDE